MEHSALPQILQNNKPRQIRLSNKNSQTEYARVTVQKTLSHYNTCR